MFTLKRWVNNTEEKKHKIQTGTLVQKAPPKLEGPFVLLPKIQVTFTLTDPIFLCSASFAARSLTALFSGISRFFRTPFVRHTLLVCSTATLAGNFTLALRAHSRKASSRSRSFVLIFLHTSLFIG
jgi:hypothetical protein